MSIDAMIEKMRELGASGERVAKAAVPLVEAAVKATAAAGLSPNGKPWPARKDGKQALVNAAAAVACRARGSVVQLYLQGTSTGSQKVQAVQNARRGILPAKGEGPPPVVVAALEEAGAKVFKQIMEGG
jgi:hypothetical protein